MSFQNVRIHRVTAHSAQSQHMAHNTLTSLLLVLDLVQVHCVAGSGSVEEEITGERLCVNQAKGRTKTISPPSHSVMRQQVTRTVAMKFCEELGIVLLQLCQALFLCCGELAVFVGQRAHYNHTKPSQECVCVSEGVNGVSVCVSECVNEGVCDNVFAQLSK